MRLENLELEKYHNYQKLKEALDKRGIKLISVEYLMRKIGPLKAMFKGRHEDILFVDNEAVFKKAFKKARYSEYFWDMIGGDFDHCTPKGNRLLANNIAEAILKNYFLVKDK